jgi:hypothetical protein
MTFLLAGAGKADQISRLPVSLMTIHKAGSLNGVSLFPPIITAGFWKIS